MFRSFHPLHKLQAIGAVGCLAKETGFHHSKDAHLAGDFAAAGDAGGAAGVVGAGGVLGSGTIPVRSPFPSLITSESQTVEGTRLHGMCRRAHAASFTRPNGPWLTK
jgi:hypothetical protein